jgi:succinate dehydrogenase/fumarate reductase flavoprotein subunit
MPLVKNAIMPVLRAKVLDAGANVLDRVMIIDLLRDADRICGAAGFDARNGAFHTITARATVVATGSGAFKVPGWTDSYWTADGDAMCYRAGAEMVGKEFGGKDGGVLKEFGSTRIGVAGGYNRYVNGLGEPFIRQYAPKYETETRRMISSLFEVHAGKGPIFLDFEAAAADERNRAVASSQASGLDKLAEKVGFDARTVGKTEVSFGSWVGNQPSQGGVLVDTDCASTLPGLYAAGDCAGTRMCGSCYAPMGYGLAGASVTGYRAGRSAALFASTAGQPQVDAAEVARLRKITYAPLERAAGFGTSFLTETLRNLVVPYFVMQVKHGERLKAALTFLEFVKGHLIPRMRADDIHDLRKAHEVRNMTLNAEMCLKASLFRTESRGTHYREDFPHRMDPEWLAWTVLKENNGEMSTTKRPIPRDWWPDLSVPYRERYELRFPPEVARDDK